MTVAIRFYRRSRSLTVHNEITFHGIKCGRIFVALNASSSELRGMPRIADELRSTFESEQQKALLNTLFTANWLRSKEVERFRSFGISPEQYNILRILRGAKGQMKMHDVRDRMIDRAPNTTRLTDKLVIKDLVHRERCDADRRVVFVSITKEGLLLLDRIDMAVRTDARIDQERLNDKEAALLNDILDKWRG